MVLREPGGGSLCVSHKELAYDADDDCLLRGIQFSFNSMAANLTFQVREIATVTKAVANGDLSKTVNIEASGEIQ